MNVKLFEIRDHGKSGDVVDARVGLGERQQAVASEYDNMAGAYDARVLFIRIFEE